MLVLVHPGFTISRSDTDRYSFVERANAYELTSSKSVEWLVHRTAIDKDTCTILVENKFAMEFIQASKIFPRFVSDDISDLTKWALTREYRRDIEILEHDELLARIEEEMSINEVL